MRRSTYLCIVVVVAAGTIACGGRSHALTTLFLDTFDRPDNADIDAVTTGITNNTGTVFGASAVYSQPWIDPTNNPTEGVANNGGAERILSNQLQLAVGAGTSNAFVNHNFTNSVITTDGGFKVSIDIGTYTNTTNGFGGAFAVGMSLAEAQSGHDANDGTTNPATTVSKFTNAFQDTAFSGAVVSDFYLGLRGNSTLAWGSGNAAPTIVSVAAKTGTISANFNAANFNAGSTVNYEVFYNGASQGIGSFIWSGTNENYIGLDARDPTAVNLDNFTIATIPPSPKPTLVISRDTGNITLKNLASSPLSIAAYSIITAQGGFNQANWSKIQSQGIDTNDTWITFTSPSSTTDLAEGTLGEYTIPGTSGQINLGNAWRRSPFEDLAFELRDGSGNDVPVLVQYTGNGGNAFKIGDFNLDNLVNASDWVILRNHLTSNVSAMSQIDRYFVGDLNNDGLVNQADFRLFKPLYLAGPGGGGIADFGSVPEPSSLALFILATTTLLVAKPRRRRSYAYVCFCAFVALCGLAMGGRAQAADLFVDTFDRPDNHDIDAVTTGITNNTGTVFGASAVYTSPWVDPATTATAVPPFGSPDTDSTNGGGQQILSNQLQLKYNPGTANLVVNHNFTNASITSARGFSVSLDLANYNQTTNGQGAAIAVGMSLAEALLAHDANDGNTGTGGSPIAKFSNAFQDTAFTTGSVVSDFYLALRGNSTIAWGPGGTSNVAAPRIATVAAKTGTISANFILNDFNAGSTAAYQVFYNGVSQGFGGFTWSGTNENYVGLDGRDDTVMAVDNFKVQTVTGLTPQTLRLQVNTSTGAAFIVGGGSSNALDFYEITSPGGGLVAGNFDGIRGDGGLPSGNGTGNGWEIGGSNSAGSLTEAYALSESTIAANASAMPIGSIYNTIANTHDLHFTYTSANNLQQLGFIEYITGSLPDFNGNHFVDAADYTIWRDNLGRTGATFSQGDANGDGTVNITDFNIWKANFGSPAGAGGGGLGTSTVPEPSSVVLLLVAGAAFCVKRLRWRTVG